ncbi:MAG TPA: choice-of-anchor tandem repeat GloVer-containing protein [Rhizomicrobium sp.]|jgi:uncharacterized repeat protein (TIGR03803 family)
MRSGSRFFGKCLLACSALVALSAAPVLAGDAAPKKIKDHDTLLYSFGANASDGAYPFAGLIADSSGDFFGTTEYGGTNNLGTVFELSSSGTESVLYSFAGGASDGAIPAASLISDSLGNLYGTTVNGGSGDCSDAGCGTVFEVTPAGAEKVIYQFQGDADGLNPQASLFMDGSGNLFGTTYAGGSQNCEGGCGTVFELSPSKGGGWTESVIYSFQGGNDGDGPQGGLVEDSSGNLYGTTSFGGASTHCPTGCGTVFQLSPSGNGSWTNKVIYFFKPPLHGGDGAYPASNLMMDGQGNLWGTTPQGGSKSCGGGCGAVFELAKTGKNSWAETTPFRFAAGKHGAFPTGTVVSDSSHNLYGVTAGAGTSDCGVLYEIYSSGQGKTLYSFAGGASDGCQGYGTLFMGQNSTLYGVTAYGGASDVGAIFQLKP